MVKEFSRAVEDHGFATGDFDTRYLDQHPELIQPRQPSEDILAESAVAATLAAWVTRQGNRTTLGSIPSGWRNSFYRGQVQAYTYKEQTLQVEYRYSNQTFTVKVGGTEATVKIVTSNNEQLTIELF